MALSHFYLLFACIIAAALAVPPQSGTATVTFYQRAASWTHGGTGACGIPASGQLPYFTAAVNSRNFDSGGSEWLGDSCGMCYRLTNTGTNFWGTPYSHLVGKSIVVKITNLCPAQYNQEWCTAPNARGYSTHFDIGEDMQGGPSPVSALGDGVNKVYEVTFRRVSCSEWNGPSSGSFTSGQFGQEPFDDERGLASRVAGLEQRVNTLERIVYNN